MDMKTWPSSFSSRSSTLSAALVSEAQPLDGSANVVAGGVGAGQAWASATLGSAGLPGSAPPPTRARLVSDPAAPAATCTGRLIVALAPAAIAVARVQSRLLLPAVHVQEKPPLVKGEAPV